MTDVAEHRPELSPSEARRILEARAKRLAQPLPEPPARRDALELLVFSRGGGTYAVDATVVVEVFALGGSTPVPSTPPAVTGIVNHRGRIVPLVDIARLVAATAHEAEASLAVAVEAGEATFALPADDVSGIVRIAESEVVSGAELSDKQDVVIRGLTAELIAVLDVDALSQDPRVEVDDEIE